MAATKPSTKHDFLSLSATVSYSIVTVGTRSLCCKQKKPVPREKNGKNERKEEIEDECGFELVYFLLSSVRQILGFVSFYLF